MAINGDRSQRLQTLMLSDPRLTSVQVPRAQWDSRDRLANGNTLVHT